MKGRPRPGRQEYAATALDPETFAADPMAQFGVWFGEVVAAGLPEPDAMTLATAGPSARMVLLKGWDAAGFLFATNYGSRKAEEIVANPAVALTFRWAALERQVCVCGTARRTGRARNAEIFAARPRGAQLAAWASRQSTVVPDRAALDRAYADAEARYAGRDVPCPPYWGGILVRPVTVEFWQGRPNRMHDRLRYRRAGRRWVLERLAP